MTEHLSVGFVGMGRMGAPMAGRVAEAGFPLTVWNRSTERCDPLASLGATVADMPKELAERSDVVVTMVADADALRAILEGDDGLLAGLQPDAIVVDTSTIGPTAAVEFAQAVSERGAHWIDAPVSGSTALAEKGELALMIGGEPSAIARAKPVLDAISAKQFHLGGAGTGAAMKLAVNSAIAVFNEAIAEGLVLAEEAGIEREAAYDVFAGGALAAPYVLYKRNAFVQPEETPVAFTVSLMRKDLELARRLADDLGVEMKATQAADDVLARACDLGLGDADFASVARVIRDR
jgi:3-hydroxyisobutyrate dehydrogenase-like beta-hydroxyacid dehydrogenase